MNAFDPPQGAQSVYNFWLSLIPQFMGQFAPGAMPQMPPAMPWMSTLMFPADQIAKAAEMTHQSLQSMAKAMAPMLQPAAMPNMFTQWAAAMPAVVPTVESMGQAWTDFGSLMGLPSNADVNTAFDRTYGALADALGLGPTRRLQGAWQELMKAAASQQEARASYALVVNAAFVAGYRRLVEKLAEKAAAGERIDSVLALLKLWAVCTEEAVHETLQSESGLAATAALTRGALTYQKAVQKVSNVLADMLALSTRRDLDEAFREIQVLKRELRTLRRSGAAS